MFRITNPDLLRLRYERLQRRKQKNIIVTGSGRLKVSDYRLFQSEEVEAWIATTPEGRKRLGDPGKTPALVFGHENSLDLDSLLHALREEHGVRYLLCEGGPTLYGHMVRGGWMDEKFLTIAPQEIGPVIPDSEPGLREMEEDTLAQHRLSTIAGAGFSIESARWYRWISCRKAGDHEFNRYRFVPREPAGKPPG